MSAVFFERETACAVEREGGGGGKKKIERRRSRRGLGGKDSERGSPTCACVSNTHRARPCLASCTNEFLRLYYLSCLVLFTPRRVLIPRPFFPSSPALPDRTEGHDMEDDVPGLPGAGNPVPPLLGEGAHWQALPASYLEGNGAAGL